MNSIKHVTSGLASSLFLTAGLTRLAEKMDPITQNKNSKVTLAKDVRSCEWSNYPCNFTPQTGQ